TTSRQPVAQPFTPQHQDNLWRSPSGLRNTDRRSLEQRVTHAKLRAVLGAHGVLNRVSAIERDARAFPCRIYDIELDVEVRGAAFVEEMRIDRVLDNLAQRIHPRIPGMCSATQRLDDRKRRQVVER